MTRYDRLAEWDKDGLMSFAEIAKELGTNRHAVRALYKRAMRKLQRRPGCRLMRELAAAKGQR